MTRWARSGSTQRHRKLPEDPTPWEEFALQNKQKAKYEKKFQCGKIEKQSHLDKKSKGIFRNLKHVFVNEKPVQKSRLNVTAQGSATVTSNDTATEKFDGTNYLAEEFNENKKKILEKNYWIKQSISSDNETTDKNVSSNEEIMLPNMTKNPETYCTQNTHVSTYQTNEEISNQSKKLKKERKFKKNFEKNGDELNHIMVEEIASKKTTELVNPTGKIKRKKNKSKIIDPKLYQNTNEQSQNSDSKESDVIENEINARKRKENAQLQDFDQNTDQITTNDTTQITIKKKIKQRHSKIEVQNFEAELDGNETTHGIITETGEETKNIQKKSLVEFKGLDSTDNGHSIDGENQKTVNTTKQGKKWLDGTREKRLKNGTVLLPKKIEKKLYMMKIVLGKKGIPKKMIKERIREVRRKEELKLTENEGGKWLDRIREKRLKNGIVLLPPKIERKLYLMKRALREKGMPGEKIKEMVREIRRKEELKLRPNTKTCLNCRQTGHILSSCPMIAADVDQGTGICFKCGSTEHTSYKCRLKISDFPFAKCFICHKQGHLSRKCPENSRGIFPKGGKCNLCGSIDHLKIDCPKLKKTGDDDSIVTVNIMSGLTSVDDEVTDVKVATNVAEPKKSKLVKF